MKFTAQKTKSGFVLQYQPSSLENGAIDSSGKIVPIDEPYIHPKKVDDAIIYSADLDELYDDLCIEVLRIAQNFDWDESIEKLANKWGHLQCKLPLFLDESDMEILKSGHANSANNKFFLNNNSKEIDITYAKSEYESWHNLLFYIIPYAKFGEEFLKNNGRLDSYLWKINECIDDGVRVEFKKHQRLSYDVIPLNLLAAITLFAQKKRASKNKKEIKSKTCNYGPCSNKLEIKLGKGRERMYCSNSCKVLMSKYGENGPEEHKTKIGKCAYKGCGKEITIKLGKGRQRQYCNSTCRVKQLKMQPNDK